jgi:5-methylcytosine-specific restriction enzyme A
MNTYLITWNSHRWFWSPEARQAAVDGIERGERVFERWSCGNRKAMPIGSRVFLLKQGPEPRGLVASGYCTTQVFQEAHWDPEIAARGGETNYIEFEYDHLLAHDDDPLPVRDIAVPDLRRVNWSTQASGIQIDPAAAVVLEQLWAGFTGRNWVDVGLDAETAALEGETRRHLVLHRRREAKLRAAKLEQVRNQQAGHIRCEVPGCGFDFEEAYGAVGAGYAQVHHLRPLHTLDEPSLTRLDDLAVVCANCHAMIHRGGECRDLAELMVNL